MAMLLHADARRIPLPDGCIHTCVTSPPYFGLRSYLDNDDPLKPLEVGSEQTPDEYVAAMVEVFREVRRVLRDDGTLWCNLGDSYSDVGRRNERRAKDASGVERPGATISCERCGASFEGGIGRRFCSSFCGGSDNSRRSKRPGRLKHKDLLGIPWMVAFALRDDGWYLRSAPPWIKPAPMPESIVDRPGTSHEYVFLLSKSEDYFYDVQAVRKTMAPESVGRYAYAFGGAKSQHLVDADKDGMGVRTRPVGFRDATDGRNRRTNDWFTESLDEQIAGHEQRLAELRRVRDDGGLLVDEEGMPSAFYVNTSPFKGSHFAVMPPKLVEPCIASGTSERGCCPHCGGPWVRVVERTRKATRPGIDSKVYATPPLAEGSPYRTHAGTVCGNRDPQRHVTATRTLGWEPSCDCPAHEPVSCRVFDPFGGAATVPLVAEMLGRVGIMTELNAEYIRLGKQRLDRPHAPVRSHGTSSSRARPGQGKLFSED